MSPVPAYRLALRIAIFVLATAFLPGAFSQTAKKEAPTHGTEFKGHITMTTADDGMLTFITMASPRKKEPLTAAFVVQHRTAARPGLAFNGEGLLVYNEDATSNPLAVWVKPANSEGWQFKIDRYGGFQPANSIDVVGVARFWWEKGAKRFPSSHAQFVKERLK